MMMMLTVMILEKKIKIGKDDGGGYDYKTYLAIADIKLPKHIC